MRVELWTDGSGNTADRPGGWAYVLVAVDEATGELLRKVEGSGGVQVGGSNNRMELAAVIEGLRALTRPASLTVCTDSEYVARGFGWVPRWEGNGWRTAGGDPVKNVDLWRQLVAAASPHAVTFRHVDGHAGIELNERCDELAGQARKAIVAELAAAAAAA